MAGATVFLAPYCYRLLISLQVRKRKGNCCQKKKKKRQSPSQPILNSPGQMRVGIMCTSPKHGFPAFF